MSYLLELYNGENVDVMLLIITKLALVPTLMEKLPSVDRQIKVRNLYELGERKTSILKSSDDDISSLVSTFRYYLDLIACKIWIS